MGNQHAYCVGNAAFGLSTGSYVWSDSSSANIAFLSDNRMDQVFTSTVVSSTLSVVITFPVPVSLNCIALLNSNIAGANSPQVQVQSSPNNVTFTTQKTANPNTVPPRDREMVLQFPTVSAQYWKIIWTWTGGFQLTLGEIFMGLTTQTQRYTVFGDAEEDLYLTADFQTYTGETRTVFQGGPIRQKTLKFQDLSQSERDDLTKWIAATKKSSLAFLFCWLYDNTNSNPSVDQMDCIFGKFMSDVKTTGFDFARWNIDPIVIRSLARDVGH